MAVKKICGIETEYGITAKGALADNPILSSSLLVQAYQQVTKAAAKWDFEAESPGRDARGATPRDARPPAVETGLTNLVLTNGARLYVDHAHPEYSSPECGDAFAATRYDVAGERILRAAMKALPAEHQGILVYKNNSDGKGNSYGCHENYLMDRSLPFDDLVRGVLPFFVARQLFGGAGKVGSELPTAPADFQISQRADFMEEAVGLETTMRRPIVNTRDEPHADFDRFRRLHVICGDANLSAYATALKLGATSLVLCVIEEGLLDADLLTLAKPVQAFRDVSRDTSLRMPLDRESGGAITALEILGEYLAAATKYTENEGFDAVGGETVGRRVLEMWTETLHDLEIDPLRCRNRLDWVAKKNLIDGYRDRHHLQPGDLKLKALDLQYHDIRPEKSLASRCGLVSLITEEEAESACAIPPEDTRAYFRGECLRRWPEAVTAANWESLVFDVDSGPLRRVPMKDPERGTKAVLEPLLDSCQTPEELLKALRG